MVLKQLRVAILSLAVFTVLTGVFYPLVVTLIAQLIFPEKANGSFVRRGEWVLGSALIGQPFSGEKYFWGRLSATAPVAYNAGASAGSNYGPLHPALLDAVRMRVQALKASDPQNTRLIPVDLVTASGSGLDPHISVAAALYQVPRIARSRGLREERVRDLVDQHTDARQLGLLGEPCVNVLTLNLALDGLTSSSQEH